MEADVYQLLGIAVLVMTPVYAYLYSINQRLSAFIAIVSNCPYCNRKVEMQGIEAQE